MTMTSWPIEAESSAYDGTAQMSDMIPPDHPKFRPPRVCDQPDRWAVAARHFRENCLDSEAPRPAYGGRWQAPGDCSRLDRPWNDPTLSREMGPA